MAGNVPVTTYVPLANRVNEWFPAKAIHQREDIYCMIGPMADGEEWKFPPGTMVRRRAQILPSGKEEMVAVGI